MTKGKYIVKAARNGVFAGYLKSVSYTNGTFTTTQDKQKAKKFTSHERLEGDIDFCTGVGFADGYVFGYEPLM